MDEYQDCKDYINGECWDVGPDPCELQQELGICCYECDRHAVCPIACCDYK